LIAGIEFEITGVTGENTARITNATVVGSTENAEWRQFFRNMHGIIAPRSDNFTIEGAKFYNINWKEAAALGDCSHCFHPAATDSGART
jgi:hypothetical protein